MTKMIKTVKDYSYKKRLGKFGLTALQERRKRIDLIETFKIMEFLIMVDVLIYFLELEIYCQDRFQKLSLLTNWIFTNRSK